MAELDDFQTPMMRQYAQIKKEYQDAILFFRLGDFYEMFLDDAKVASEILGITLTARNKGKDGKIPMCGVPYHAAEGYIQRLVRNGYKVAICEQVTEPEKGKDIVEREVIRVVTPSTALNEDEDNVNADDFLMTFYYSKKKIGYALVSVKSGDVFVLEDMVTDSEISSMTKELREKLSRFSVAELLLPPFVYDAPNAVKALFQEGVSPFRYEPEYTSAKKAYEYVRTHYNVQTLEGFGMQTMDIAIIALANALSYLANTQKSSLDFLKPPKVLIDDGYMHLPRQTVRNLEIFRNLRTGDSKTSLYAVVDNAYTPMGNRLLVRWLMRPLTQVDEIEARYDVVAFFIKNRGLADTISHILSLITDMEKRFSRLALGIGNARDMYALRESLSQTQDLMNRLPSEGLPYLLKQAIGKVDIVNIGSVVKLLEDAIVEEPPMSLHEGGFIKHGYSSRLDELRSIASGGKEWLLELEQRERERTGIASLKIGFNKVFGYYIEVSKANVHKVPDYYIRRQTLTNAERYIIQELKEHEDKVLSAQDEANELELEMFNEIVSEVVGYGNDIQMASEFVAILDVLLGFSELAVSNNYTRPAISQEHELNVEEGRHPVVELVMDQSFVPNGIDMSNENQMMIITGANMAGKSTYIRQTALLVIMAQIGSFVPAKTMRFGIFDQILTRIGAMDDVAAGMSTFMVEMVETAHILNAVTDRSLVILDEIGRGTSTYDGLSIAWSVSEFLLNKTKAFIMFATHYHELTELSDAYDHVSNFHMSVAEDGGNITFLYRVVAGKASQSYGIEVAKRAGLPKAVTRRASEILYKLTSQARAISPLNGKQLELFSMGEDTED